MVFKKGAALPDGKKDEQDLAALFLTLGFDVRIHENLTGKEMVHKVESYSKMEHNGVFFLILLSHGSSVKGRSAVTGQRQIQLFLSDLTTCQTIFLEGWTWSYWIFRTDTYLHKFTYMYVMGLEIAEGKDPTVQCDWHWHCRQQVNMNELIIIEEFKRPCWFMVECPWALNHKPSFFTILGTYSVQ